MAILPVAYPLSSCINYSPSMYLGQFIHTFKSPFVLIAADAYILVTTLFVSLS